METTGELKGVILTADSDDGDSPGWHPGTGMLLPLANVSMAERILDEYERVGVKEALVAAGSDTREVASLCGDGTRWNMVLTYHDAPEDHSPNKIMEEAAAFTGGAMFLATRGPVLLPAKAYARAFQMHDDQDLRGPRGLRLWEGNRDAADDRHGSDGVYLLAADVRGFVDESDGVGGRSGQRTGAFDTVSESRAVRACSFGSILDTLAGRSERVLDMAPEYEPYDVGTPETYLESNERLLESTDRDVAPLEIMADNFSSPNLVLRPPVIIDDTAELERCRIGPGVCIGPGVRIGHGAAIEHSVIMEGADIGDGASISRAVIGRNASIANRSVVHGRVDRVTVVCPI